MEGILQTLQQNINFIWLFVCAALVFFMQAGFTLVEAGLTRAKHSINVAMKNVADIMIATMVFSLIGFPLMFGNSFNGWFGTEGFFLSGLGNDPWTWAFLFFQIAFAGTAATIVSGAIAERARFAAYLIGTVAITLLIYPIMGHWAWGSLLYEDQSGWLEKLGFMDFAGSTVVHSVGGWVALAAAIVIGPRYGKYDEKTGKSNKFPSSNLIMAALGVFILWFGWFGFNAGSTTVGNPDIALIALNTMLAGSTGGFFGMVSSWYLDRLPRGEDMLNGIIAGLVSITASCNVVSPLSALLIGAVGGVIVVFAARFFDGVLKVDDAVGAISAHGVSGAWGTLSVGIFGYADMLSAGSRMEQIGVQALGVGIAFLWAFGLGYVIYLGLKKFMKLRVDREDEKVGLNISEHGARTSLLDTIRTMNEIASEKIDLTRKLSIEPGEDTAELNESFNYLLERIHHLVEQVKKQTHFVYDSSDQMRSISENLSQNSEGQFTFVRQTYEYFGHVQDRMKGEMDTDQKTIDTFHTSIDKLHRLSNEIQSTHSTMNDMANRVRVLEQLLEQVQGSTASLLSSISDISEYSSDSADVVRTITDISEEINLLSLNARIEAARAGEYGKGFAVVAQEIKELAAQSKVSSQNIKSMLDKMIQSIDDGQKSAKHFGSIFYDLNQELIKVPEQIKQMSSMIHMMNEEMLRFVEDIRQLEEGISAMKKTRLRQQDELDEMMTRIQNVLTQFEQNSAFTTEINDKVGELKTGSNFLGQLVMKFKTQH